MKKCCVLGLGYIGLPTSVIIAKNGFEVVGIDLNPEIVANISKGIIHINEKDLDEALRNVLQKNTFKAQLIPTFADIFLIAVPTPFKENNTQIPTPNTDYVFAAAKSISKYLKKDNLIIIESTCPVGTTEKVAALIYELTGLSKSDLNFAYCPERVIPGKIISELISNDRIIGGLTEKASQKAKDFYLKFCQSKVHTTTANTAELVKLSENAYRDVNIAFANEISIISEKFKIDPYEMIKLANFHPRVNILKPGCGVGGHCIAVDPYFIVSAAPFESTLIKTARKVNNNKIDWVINNIIKEIEVLQNKVKKNIQIGIMGLTYKANTDDIRNSPSIKIYKELEKRDLSLLACEPFKKEIKGIELISIDQIIEKSDLLIFLTDHNCFKTINFKKINYLDYCGISKSL